MSKTVFYREKLNKYFYAFLIFMTEVRKTGKRVLVFVINELPIKLRRQ